MDDLARRVAALEETVRQLRQNEPQAAHVAGRFDPR
jgi:hypothetical protein